MFRKTAVALALLLLTVSIRLNALGLGEIEMQSALNQPMKAAISLNSVAGVDISQIKIALASREEHERLGLTRVKILSDFKFEVTEDGRGMSVINVSSSDPVREPYLEFLLEMAWENGRMVREYTVLVDPPVTMPAIPAAPVAPVVQAPAVVPARTEPARPVRPAPVAKTAPTTYRPAPVAKKANTYGAVRREEALWGIADRLRSDSDITIQQMMLALLRANPEAFADNNINNLKAGSMLTIPDREAILSLTANQARAEATRQFNEWRQKRNAARAAVQEKPAVEKAAAIEEPVVDVPAETVVATQAQLKLTPPEGEPVAGSASTGVEASVPGSEATGDESIHQKLALAQEEIEAGKAKSDELQSRVLELEATIKRMERLLMLKSDPLASLQNEVASQAAEPAPGDVGDAEEVAVPDTGVEVPVGEADQPAATASEDESVVAAVEDSPVGETGGVVNRLMDNPVLAGIGVLVAMLLGGFLWGSMRQNRNQGMFDDEPTLDKHIATGSQDAQKSEGTEFTVSDPGTFEQDTPEALQEVSSEVANDPITEADVYLAYGRVHQAEDVLQAALKDNPDNIAIRAKLLEVFHAAGNVAAFNIAASEYRELAPEDDGHWSGIATMGHELSPGNELYSAAKQLSGEANNLVDFDMDLSGMDDTPSRSTVDADDADADDLALTLDIETSGAAEVPESLEFSLDDDVEDEAQGEGLLASTDEVATKLDLARAYLDMEDPEGARSILQEVIEEGSAEQKNEAQALISNIV